MSEPIIIVSSDGHAGGPPEMYLDYIDPAYREHVTTSLVQQTENWRRFIPRHDRLTSEVLDVIDADDNIRSGGASGAWDWSRRLVEMDHDGVAADVIDWGVNESLPPFFSFLTDPCPPDLRWAGVKAYHRFLADGIDAGGGRFRGVATPGPCFDMEATVAELEWAAEHGLTSVVVPGSPLDPDLPPLHAPYFEPFWAKCAELEMVLRVHAGWGLAQGTFTAMANVFFRQAQADGDGSKDGPVNILREAGRALSDEVEPLDSSDVSEAAAEFLANDANSMFQLDMQPRRLIWQLMLAGVFDRHPGLQFVLTEMRADWVPITLAHLDASFERGEMPLRKRPSEYWDQHFWTVPSSPHVCEIEMRKELGMQKMLFGVDFPHLEGTWPNTKDWIRHAFADVPEAEARAILGEQAIDVFGFDRKLLAKVAERIGPSPADVLGGGFNVDQRLLEAFHVRAGMLRGPDPVDTDLLENFLRQDLAAVASV